jgi:hypothetical protein
MRQRTEQAILVPSHQFAERFGLAGQAPVDEGLVGVHVFPATWTPRGNPQFPAFRTSLRIANLGTNCPAPGFQPAGNDSAPFSSNVRRSPGVVPGEYCVMALTTR